MKTENDIKSILFIDDEPDTLRRMDFIFGSYYECYFTETGKSGLKQFDVIQPDLVVCDVNLPDISGYDISHELKSNNPNVCIILLSIYNDKVARLKGLESFADTYIDKSLSDEEIYLRVRNLHPKSSDLPYTGKINQLSPINDRLYLAFSELYCISHSSKEPLVIKDVAKHLALSSRSLQRKLSEETNLSFTQHHFEYRITEAKKRIKLGYKSTDIADFLRFSSPAHFSSWFKKELKMTPTAYLRSI